MQETPSPWLSGIAGKCPKCGEGKLFNGLLTPQKRCNICGLDFSFIDSGDGPAIFAMLGVGFLIVGAALYVEFTYEPPFWLHGLLWLPGASLLCLGILRPLKGLLINLQYAHDARQGTSDQP